MKKIIVIMFSMLWVWTACQPGGTTEKEPQTDSIMSQEGQASWYGPGLNGNPTASGEKFDMEKLTAAHPKLPFGTKVKVINLSNGKSVVVTINDRGPYAKNRIIDLSKAAARKIDILETGHTEVRIEILK